MERLTARSGNGLAYLSKVKPNEQEVESNFPNTLKCIMECFERLAHYEDLDEQGLLARLKSHAVWCKDCKWFYEEACSNGKSDWCTDFPSEYNSCEFCEAKENDNEID